MISHGQNKFLKILFIKTVSKYLIFDYTGLVLESH